jgi:hypothetical protein
MSASLGAILMHLHHRHLLICVPGNDHHGRIIFTNFKRLPRAARNGVKSMTSGTVKPTVTDTTLPIGPIEHEIVLHAPFTKCHQERDYATVWQKLEDSGKTTGVA